jgi:CheY-like chemotaxis protein
MLEYRGVSVKTIEQVPVPGDFDRRGSDSQVLLIDVPSDTRSAAALLDSLPCPEWLEEQAVVVLLPAGNAEPAQKCEELGLSHTLTKPAKSDELIAVIRAAMQAREDESSTAPHPISGPRLRLLVAFVSPVNQAVAAGLLELGGHEVVVVSNGQEAVDAWHQQSFDAIFMDVEMPEMDGLTATGRIRDLEAELGRHTPIIALTAHALSGAREKCLAAGMDGYVSKPLEPEELFAVLASLTTSVEQQN